jgi:tetratricopeptide (TPR) repeat protein
MRLTALAVGKHRTIKVALSLVLLALVACSKPSADARLKRGNDLLAQGRTREAIFEYRLAVQIDPKRADTRRALSEAYEVVGDKEAITEAVRVADLLPKDVTAQLRAGRLLLVARNFEDAKTRAKQAIALNPKDPEGLILLGNISAGLKDFNGAITDYENAIALNNGEDLAAYENLATLQNVRGAKADAEANFRKAVAVAPKSLSAREALANFLWTTGRTADAEGILHDALASAPDDVALNRALGLLYLGTNRAKEAEPFFQTIAKKSTTPVGAFALADYYRVTRRFDDARRVLVELTKKDQTYAAAMTWLAAIDGSEGLSAAGLQKTAQVLEKYPKEMGARLLKAQLLLAEGKPDDALQVARSIPADAPTSSVAPDALMLVGALETDRGEPEAAVKAYQDVLSRQANPFGALVGLARLNFASGEIERAATYAEQALVLQPKNPIPRSLMVRVWLAEHKNGQAATELAALRKEFPNSATVLDLLAAQQLENKQSDAARASYLHALSLAPRDAEAAIGLVQLDLAGGNVSDAVTRVEAGLKQAAPAEQWFVLAAKTYVAAKDYAKAEKTLTRAIETAPSHLSGYAMLGQLFAAQGRLDDARKEYEQIVKRSPRSIPANTMLGMLFEAEGNQPEAERRYQAVVAIDDHAAVAANNLAWLYAASHRRLDIAEQLAQAAVRESPQDPHFNDTLGWTYYQQAAYHRAIPYLQTSVREDPSASQIQYHLGMAYFHDGQLDQARAALKTALEGKSQFEGVEEARKTLALLN